mmetsp:Transcript_10465/g.19679  ORF Transcript_10465/g.19679 Transcript_10465/m.19679 type:complete len:477 (+) Transcript_10465:235-1665(+)
MSKSSFKDAEESSNCMTLANALDSLGWGPFHWKFTLQCGLSWACDVIEIMLLSFLIPNIIGTVFLEDASTAKKDTYGFLLGAVTFGGILLGSLAFGWFSDRFGRRVGYLFSTLLIAIFGLLCTVSPNIETLIALRSVVGFGLGGVTCSFTLLSEVVGEKSRGKKIILSMGGLWTSGAIFSAAIAWVCFTQVPLNWQWRTFIILSAVPSVVLLGLFPFLIESPRYHLSRNTQAMADKAVETLYKIQDINKLSTLPENLKLHKLDDGASRKEWKKLFDKNFCLTTIILTCLWFLNMGAYYGICFVTPLYFKGLHDNEYLAAFISACSEVPGILASSWLVDRLGRKKTLILMYIICGIATALLSLDSYLPFAGLVTAAVISRGSAMGAIMSLYLYTPEVYPTEIRNVALGMGSAVSRVAGIITSYLSFRSGSITNATTAIIIYAVAVVVSGILTIFLPYETKDRAIDAFDRLDQEQEQE